MTEPTASAPPVVAVLVAQDPGPWFEDVLTGLAVQDYPNLRCLILDTGSSPELPSRVATCLPGAIVRRVATPSYAVAANEALRLVEGAGFFCFVHDDVALDPTTVRLLVEETYRSNAGIAGPKVVEWGAPDRLVAVGLGVDKFGDVASVVDPGELDQEQHDAVRDVFCLPAACLVVRTDLFRALGGFDRLVGAGDDDLDLCWRAHVSGARVVVVPSARARQWPARLRVRATAERADQERQRERNRLRTVVVASTGGTLARVLPQYFVVSLVAALANLLTGHVHRAGALVRAWGWNLTHLGPTLQQRKRVKALRQVPDGEVRHLQVRGSARLNAFFRRRRAQRDEQFESVTGVGRTLVEAVRTGAGRGTWATWAVVVAVFLIGSRDLVFGRIPAAGGLLDIQGNPNHLVHLYLSGWWGHGLGGSGAVPTGVALLGVAGRALFGATALLRMLLTVGMILVGAIGAWRLLRPMASRAARIAGLVVYATVAAPYNALATGRWDGLLVYGAFPWAVLVLAGLAGWAPFGPGGAVDATTAVPAMAAAELRRARRGERAVPWARLASLGLLIALVGAFVPTFALVVLATAVVLALASLVLGEGEGGGLMVGGAAVGVVIALALHFPWLPDLFASGWAGLTGTATRPAGPSPGLGALARFATGPHGSGLLAWAPYVAAVPGLVLGRAWRFSWAVRGAALVVVFLAVAWLGSRGTVVPALPGIEVVLVPVALGLALLAAASAASFEHEVRGTRFGWRQLLTFVGVAAVVLTALPTLGAATDGQWDLEHADFSAPLGLLPAQRQPGDFRVLWVGDPRAVPQPGWKLADGLVYALSQNGTPTVTDHWSGEPGRGGDLVAQALALAADGRTSRLGRILGPMSIRYIVVPLAAGPAVDHPQQYPPPSTVLGSLAGQLDLEQIDIDDSLVVYENEAWVPERAVLAPGAATASAQAGFDALVRTDIAGSTAALTPTGTPQAARGDLPAGTFYVSAPADGRWHLEVDGRAVARRPAFGWGNAFDVTTAGRASLSYATPVTRPLLVILQAVVWLAAIVLAIGGRRRHRREDEPLPAGGAALIDLGATGAHPLPWDDQIGADADWADGWPVPDAGDRSPGPDIGRDEEVGAGALDSRALQAALAPHPPSADDRADGPSDWREVAP